MKRFITCALLASFLVVNTGCFGSFSLTGKVYSWNNSLGDKWIKTIVFYGLGAVQVYTACVFVDAVVLNLVEFWTGSNPIAFESDRLIHKQFTSNDKIYDVAIGKSTITIVETKGPDAGKQITLNYKNNAAAWYLTANGSTQMVASFDPKPLNTVNIYYPDGKVVTQEISAPAMAVAVR
jgi:hypothetical protein